jgi:NodT family efflux transporter outer membrane factor (OMF) lipoprotein
MHRAYRHTMNSQALMTPAAAARAPRRSAALAALALASSALLALGGCASSAGIASQAQLLLPSSLGLEAPVAQGAAVVAPDWWRGLGDPALNELITHALSANPSLGVAQARLGRAQAAVSGTRAADGPQVNATLDASRQHFSATSIYPPPLGGSTRALGTAQLGGSWELDFFGRNRAALEAAVGAQRAMQADLQAARILLASQVARAYVQLGRLGEQRALALRAQQQRDEQLALVRQRVQSGLDTRVEQSQSEGALSEVRQQVEQWDEQLALTRHALAALAAQAPGALDDLNVSLRQLQALSLPPLLPADLLGRRADIVAARWRVEAASSEVQAAKAQFYPNVNLTAFVGLSSIGLDRLVQSASEQYGAGPALHLPIFDSGRLRSNLSGKTAELDAAIQSYNGVVLEALRDAADQLSALRSIERQQLQQSQAQMAADSIQQLSRQRYEAGLSGLAPVLNAETAVLNQRRQAVDLQARTMDSQIALIRALGGGYVAEADASGVKDAAHP